MSVKGTDNPSCYSIANERPIYTSFILVFIDVPCNHALSQHKCCWPGGPRYTRQLRWGMKKKAVFWMMEIFLCEYMESSSNIFQ